MATKRKFDFRSLGFILRTSGIAATVLCFLSLLFNFIKFETATRMVSSGTVVTSSEEVYTLGVWFDKISKLQENSNEIVGWNLGKVFLIITLVVVAILTVMLITSLFYHHKILANALAVVGVITVICASIFLISSLIGCSALSHKGVSDFTGFMKTDLVYSLSVGIYAVTLMASAAGILAVLGSQIKK